MKTKKIPQRKCVICAEHFDKKDLFRIVKDKTGNSFYDITGKANGRGYYICKSENCINKARKHKQFSEIITDEVYDVLLEKSGIIKDKKTMEGGAANE
ncbi:MAG: YlxR family protein [Tissierellia bacterium]|nr:YlxR family protein [Tissierellia bacterium]